MDWTDKKAVSLWQKQYRETNRETIKAQRQQNYKLLKADPVRHEARLKRERERYAVTAKRPWAWCFGHTRNRAKRKNLPFTLTQEWFAKHWPKGCALTGLPFQRNSKVCPYSMSVDRIVPELGYTPENCRLVLFGVNALKLNGTDVDMYRIAGALLERK